MMRLTILVDNYVNSQKLKAEHGLSILIEDGSEKILFDCGQSDLILSNAKILGIDLNEITKIVLSHSHYDHTGGLLPLLKYLNKEIDVYAHPLIFEEKFSEHKDFNGNREMKYIGIPEKINIYEKSGAIFKFIRDSIQISKNIYLSSEIPRNNNEELEELLFVKENNEFIKDPIYDDISIFINLSGLLIVVTGCAHSGILNILKKSRDLKLDTKNLAVIGGLHLAKKEKSCMDNIINELGKYSLKLLVPAHCTGRNASAQLKNNFGSRCSLASVGKILEF